LKFLDVTQNGHGNHSTVLRIFISDGSKMPLSGLLVLDRARSMMHTKKRAAGLPYHQDLRRIRAGNCIEKGNRSMPGAIHRDQHDTSPATTSPPRRRSRQAVPRPMMMRFSLTEDEHAEVQAAAKRAGRARAAFAADAVLAAARGTMLTPDTVLDAVLGDSDRLDYAAEQVRKAGVNLNQAVRMLNSTGQAPGDLPHLAQQVMRWAAQVDTRSADLWKRATAAIPGTSRRRDR
jgi:hypothetical protein